MFYDYVDSGSWTETTYSSNEEDFRKIKLRQRVGVDISNRTYKKAEDLKSQFNEINIVRWGEVPDFDIIINATSLGLNNETINLDISNFHQGKLFYDVIYNPRETNFLKLGKKLGNQIENGKLMFIYQAFEAFRLWHGIKPSVSEQILKLLDHD